MQTKLVKIFRQIQANDISWTERNLANTPFYSGYWVTQRLKNSIVSQAKRAKGILLDVGCGMKPYEKNFLPFVEKYYGIEYSPDSGYRGNRADIASDATNLPFADESFDTILCTEVLEHVSDPEKVVSEFARVLKPDGIVITTAPFFYPIHAAWDFFRYSPDGIAAIMKRYGLVVEEVRPHSGTGLTIAIMINIYLYDIGFMWTKWLYPIGLVLRPLLWLIVCLVNLGGWVLEKILPSVHMSFGHLTVARKPIIE